MELFSSSGFERSPTKAKHKKEDGFLKLQRNVIVFLETCLHQVACRMGSSGRLVSEVIYAPGSGLEWKPRDGICLVIWNTCKQVASLLLRILRYSYATQIHTLLSFSKEKRIHWGPSSRLLSPSSGTRSGVPRTKRELTGTLSFPLQYLFETRPNSLSQLWNACDLKHVTCSQWLAIVSLFIQVFHWAVFWRLFSIIICGL